PDGAPVMSEDGVPLGGVVAFEDVSEQKAAAREREQIAQFQEQFLGILGHDLRNPLNAITMAATVLTHHPGNEKVLVGRIAASAERMRRMIEQLLDLTRARRGGGIMLATKVVNLSELVSNVVDEIQIASPHCSFILALEPMLLGFWDQGRLEQVFSNVISNAVLYGRPGRPVTINLRGVGALVVCEVHNDNPEGTEIEPEQLSILFEPFRRGRSEYQRSQGLGLGLFIAKEIVTAHHGSIEVASSREQGTTFRIILPLGSG
ncbi:MAG TPA: HAMP domain-containing sensor histidine kinase, partial [Pseudomonadota bacterium]|nr:HAMP domain-containing sensor histidine kinase [Pseudomonadota bacterium]